MNKVSVVIPTYNKADYTKKTVDSVLAQTYPNLEVIVVDDGSHDNTVKVVEQYGNRVRLIQKANGGACSARNEGIRNATGEYVAFIDCDDLYYPEKIQRCIDYLEYKPQSGFVYTAVNFIDDHDRIVGIYDHHRSREGDIAGALILGNFICNSTVVVRRSVLQQVGFFDEKVFTPGDWDMWLRFSQVSQAGYIRDPLTKYRITDNYIFNRLELARREEIYVVEKFFKTYSGQGSLKPVAFSNLYLRYAQCAFIKKDVSGFWRECKLAFKTNPANIKFYAMVLAALMAPGVLKKEIEKKILRGKHDTGSSG